MGRHRHPLSQPCRRAAGAIILALALPLGGCLNGDFDRPKPSLVSDNIHGWLGAEAAAGIGIPPSTFPLTDDERLLRDLAYPLIEPPFDRHRWYSLLNEYGLRRLFEPNWAYCDPADYAARLLAKPYRSAAGRYAQLNDDIRNDVDRLWSYLSTARRVLDLDQRRGKSLALVSGAPIGEAGNAQARMAENNLIVSWVQKSLTDRAASYQYALERLVVVTPMTAAIEVERSLALLRQRIAASRLVEGPDIAPGLIVAPPVAPVLTRAG